MMIHFTQRAAGCRGKYGWSCNNRIRIGNDERLSRKDVDLPLLKLKGSVNFQFPKRYSHLKSEACARLTIICIWAHGSDNYVKWPNTELARFER
jgi:hypothetical protein